LLRRVSHDCIERGLLLQRVRDEARLTLDAYRTVFEGSVDYVTNTAWQDDADITSQRDYIKRVEDEIQALQNQESTLLARGQAIEDEGAARMESSKEQFDKLRKELEDNNAQLRKFKDDLQRSLQPNE